EPSSLAGKTISSVFPLFPSKKKKAPSPKGKTPPSFPCLFLVQVASHPVLGTHFLPGGNRLRANVHRLGATGAEPATARRIDRAGNIPLQNDALPTLLLVGVGNRHRRQERFGIRMKGMFVQLLTVGQFHQLSEEI